MNMAVVFTVAVVLVMGGLAGCYHDRQFKEIDPPFSLDIEEIKKPKPTICNPLRGEEQEETDIMHGHAYDWIRSSCI